MADYSTGTNGITSPGFSHPYDGTYISDNIYADVTGNDLPDIIFARMTAQNETHLQIMVTKFLDYERNPPTSENFYNNPTWVSRYFKFFHYLFVSQRFRYN